MTLIGRPVPDPVIFRGPLGEITKAIGPHTDADPVGIHLSLLALTGAIIGRDTYVFYGKRQPLLVWPILMGRTSLGRKGTATDQAADLFEAAFPKFMRQRVVNGMQQSGAAIVAGLTRRAVRLDGRGTDAYDEEDAGLLEEEEEESPSEGGVKRFISKPGYRGIIIETEMKKFLARAKLDSDMSPILRKVWEGGVITSETKKETFTLTNPNVSLVCHIPPKEFVSVYSASDAAGGSMNRMFCAFVFRSKVMKLPKPVPEAVMERNVRAISDIVEFGTDLGELKFEADAEALWDARIWDEIDEVINESELMEEFAGRAMPYAWRIAGLYAIARKSRTINAADLESAYGLVRYMLDSVRYVFSEYAAEANRPQGRKIEEAPFAGDPRLAKPNHVQRLIDIAREAGEEGQKSGKFLQRMNVSSDQLGHAGAAAEAQGLVKRYKASGQTGAPAYFIVYMGPDDVPSVPVMESIGSRTELPAKAPVAAKSAAAAAERRSPELVATSREPSVKPTPPRLKVPTKPIAKPKPVIKVNVSSGSDDLLAGFF
ncbi:DUF3987 domain-containing protein [Nonomuraea sp. NPDC049141]|uniref:DUF3987 domain-containing protein n=1 Tax=Nonomuraea sp. NPDC049141 TaxID=3155500 RepID=UPI0034008753